MGANEILRLAWGITGSASRGPRRLPLVTPGFDNCLAVLALLADVIPDDFSFTTMAVVRGEQTWWQWRTGRRRRLGRSRGRRRGG